MLNSPSGNFDVMVRYKANDGCETVSVKPITESAFAEIFPPYKPFRRFYALGVSSRKTKWISVHSGTVLMPGAALVLGSNGHYEIHPLSDAWGCFCYAEATFIFLNLSTSTLQLNSYWVCAENTLFCMRCTVSVTILIEGWEIYKLDGGKSPWGKIIKTSNSWAMESVIFIFVIRLSLSPFTSYMLVLRKRGHPPYWSHEPPIATLPPILLQLSAEHLLININGK